MSIGAVGSDANYYRTNDKQGRKTKTCGLGDFSNAVQNFKETNQLTAEELKEDKDWRDMSSDEWDKTLEGVDEYIDAAKGNGKVLDSWNILSAPKIFGWNF